LKELPAEYRIVNIWSMAPADTTVAEGDGSEETDELGSAAGLMQDVSAIKTTAVKTNIAAARRTKRFKSSILSA
jgi:hypothetical protein